jgi:hypothetical protein
MSLQQAQNVQEPQSQTPGHVTEPFVCVPLAVGAEPTGTTVTNIRARNRTVCVPLAVGAEHTGTTATHIRARNRTVCVCAIGSWRRTYRNHSHTHQGTQQNRLCVSHRQLAQNLQKPQSHTSGHATEPFVCVPLAVSTQPTGTTVTHIRACNRTVCVCAIGSWHRTYRNHSHTH